MWVVGEGIKQLAATVIIGNMEFGDGRSEAEDRQDLPHINEVELRARDCKGLQIPNGRKETCVEAGRMTPTKFQALEVREAEVHETER